MIFGMEEDAHGRPAGEKAPEGTFGEIFRALFRRRGKGARLPLPAAGGEVQGLKEAEGRLARLRRGLTLQEARPPKDSENPEPARIDRAPETDGISNSGVVQSATAQGSRSGRPEP